jgi:hypothetical protein
MHGIIFVMHQLLDRIAIRTHHDNLARHACLFRTNQGADAIYLFHHVLFTRL